MELGREGTGRKKREHIIYTQKYISFKKPHILKL